MAYLNSYVDVSIIPHLTIDERDYLESIFKRFSGYPSLEQVWGLMDEVWLDLGCDPYQLNELWEYFYRHPVWLLNGLFIEQDVQSLANRQAFTKWIARQSPLRIADFGGGFGSLARFVGQALPNAQIEIVEPHPRASAVALVSRTSNVRFVPELTAEYDLIIATDVFEHVPDPLGLCANTANHLLPGGKYLIANCFQPVIKCHLPQLFHFEYGWDSVMQAMGFELGECVEYGRAYQRIDRINLGAAREAGERARRLYPFIRSLPKGRVRLGRLAMKFFGQVE